MTPTNKKKKKKIIGYIFALSVKDEMKNERLFC